MPKIYHNTNGRSGPTPGGNRSRKHLAGRFKLRAAFEKAQSGTDDIAIGGSEEGDDDIITATMADVAELIASVKYLVRGWVPSGMVTGFIAEPGVGKSAFALWMARTVMVGGRWFTGAAGPKPGSVLWCPTENDMAITKDRMEKWGIPFDKLLLPFVDDPLVSVDLLNESHLERIEALIRKYRPLAMFVDSLRGSHDGDENNSRVGKVLQNLGAIAERTGAAVIVVHHTKKLLDGEEVSANSSRGSNSILALFRSQLGFDKPDPNSDWVRVRMLKQNLGLAPKPFGLRITDKGLEFGEAPEQPRKETQKDEASEWLRKRMKAGTNYCADDLQSEAEQNGIAVRTLRRAATQELGIKPKQVRKGNKISGWTWRLPG